VARLRLGPAPGAIATLPKTRLTNISSECAGKRHGPTSVVCEALTAFPSIYIAVLLYSTCCHNTGDVYHSHSARLPSAIGPLTSYLLRRSTADAKHHLQPHRGLILNTLAAVLCGCLNRDHRGGFHLMPTAEFLSPPELDTVGRTTTCQCRHCGHRMFFS